MKTSSETESVATRPPDLREETDLTEKQRIEVLSDQDPGLLPSPCHERDVRASPVRALHRCRRRLLGFAERRGQHAILLWRYGALSLLSSRLPREH